MGKKKNNDYNCRLSNEIYRRITIVKNDGSKKYARLIRDKGFLIRYGGRDIGLVETQGSWIAIDIKTGVRIEHTKYKRRGNLINYLKKRVNEWQSYIKNNRAKFNDLEDTLKRLQDLYDYGKQARMQ